MPQLPLPILDFQQFIADDKARDLFLSRLRDAAHHVGFFYLINHGIDEQIIENANRSAEAFFQLPLEEKVAVHMVNSPHFRGYTNLYDEITRDAPDRREQFDYMPEYPAYPLEEIPVDEPWLRLQGPNQWPEALPQLKEHLLTLQKAQTEVAKELLRAFALALGQPEDIFAPTLANKPSVLSKAIHYPGISGEEQGVGPHKDSGYLTFVSQDEVSGLEVLKGDEWVLAPPIKGSFVVNIGELLEVASHGYLKATYHRVQAPPKGVDRYSLAFFLTSQLDVTVPLLDLPEALAKGATGVTEDPKNPLFTQIGKNFLKGRLRSHPDVAERHYPGIQID